jgi:hypothetical protein
MEDRMIDATFLSMLIELRFALDTVRDVLGTDEVVATLIKADFGREKFDNGACELAQPILINVLLNLRASSTRQLPDSEQQVICSTLITAIQQALNLLTDKEIPGFARRTMTQRYVNDAWQLFGMVIRSEKSLVAAKITSDSKGNKRREAKVGTRVS